MRIPPVILVILSALTAGTAAAVPPVVSNPADPPLTETWTLREVWRLDYEQDESLPLMGTITQAVVDDEGRVLLLDSQLGHVLEIGPDGDYLGTLGRAGQGPGELEEPNTLFLASGGEIGLVQSYPGKIVFLNGDGTPAGSMTAGGVNPAFFQVRERSGNLVVSGQNTGLTGGEGSRMESHQFIRSYSRDRKLRYEFLASDQVVQWDPPVSDETNRWFPSWAWDQATDGSVVIPVDRDSYRLDWFEPDGELRRTIVRDFEPYRRTQQDKDRVAESMRMFGPGGELHPKKIILDTEPALEGVRCMRDGGLWVKSCFADRDLPEGIAVRYDVFDSEGRLEKEVRVALDLDDDTDYFDVLPDGRFLWFRGMRSAMAARFAAVEGGLEEEAEPEPVPVRIVLLERAP